MPGSPNTGVRYANDEEGEWGAPVPSGRRSRHSRRRACVAAAEPTAIKMLMREMRSRAGLSDAEIGRRLGVSRQAITEVQNSFDTTDHPRKPSFLWFLRYSAICGARVIVEFGEE